MPYRRLPTTDLARQRAMKKALHIAVVKADKSAILPNTAARLEDFSNKFEQFRKQVDHYRKLKRQRNQELKGLETRARLYISHFILVLNMAIERDELKTGVLHYYGLNEIQGRLPPLSGGEEILKWGEKIIAGEQKRISSGGNPVYNPSIALVKVALNEFRDAYFNFRNLKETFHRTSETFRMMRKQCNQMIASVWDEIETQLEEFPPKHKRQRAEEYGVVYIFRRREKKKLKAGDLQGDLLFE